MLHSLVINGDDTDITLQVCVYPHSLLNSSDVRSNSDTRLVITEEIFENKYYNSLSGWVTNRIVLAHQLIQDAGVRMTTPIPLR